jgi:hypothetical protein
MQEILLAPVPGRRTRIAAILVLVAAMLFSIPTEAGYPYEQGVIVELTGIVTDGSGAPLKGIHVIFEAQREKMNYLKLRKEEKDDYRITARTNQNGEYTIRWQWNRYYNAFDLLVAVPSKRAGKDDFHILSTTNVDDKLKAGGSPVVTPLLVPDATYFYTYQRFLSIIDSEEEKRIFELRGQPEKLDLTRTPDGGETSTWWYFTQGRAYRFEGGVIVEQTDFAPVKDF